MIKSIYILITCMCSFSALNAQLKFTSKSEKTHQLKLATADQLLTYKQKIFHLDTFATSKTSLLISKNYSKLHFGLFCKLENKLEKSTHIPIRFRLGNLDYVNKLEGKQ